MTELKFTPGPWLIKPMHSIVRKRENETDPWRRQYPFCVATMVEGDSKVKEANANLIAAAPEMYKNGEDEIIHLQTLKNQICCLLAPKKDMVVTLDFVLKYIDEIIGDTENLLAKARGEVKR